MQSAFGIDHGEFSKAGLRRAPGLPNISTKLQSAGKRRRYTRGDQIKLSAGKILTKLDPESNPTLRLVAR